MPSPIVRSLFSRGAVPAGGGGGVTPVLLEDFSTYSSVANLLADPRGIYAHPVEGFNTSMIALDTTVGYGSSTKSMRYDWPNNGSTCGGTTIHPPPLEIPASAWHELWAEYVIRFNPNFRVNSGAPPGDCAAEYKLCAVSDPGGVGRYNLPEMQGGAWVLSSPNGFAPTVVGSFSTAAIWDGNPHVFRAHLKLSGSGAGILKWSVDGVVIRNQTGITDTSFDDMAWFAMGLNLNQGPNIPGMQLWWHKVAIYDTDPGGGFI